MTFRSLAPDECIMRCRTQENAQKAFDKLTKSGMHPWLTQVESTEFPYELIIKIPDMAKYPMDTRNQMRIPLLTEYSQNWRLLEPHEEVHNERTIIQPGQDDELPQGKKDPKTPEEFAERDFYKTLDDEICEKCTDNAAITKAIAYAMRCEITLRPALLEQLREKCCYTKKEFDEILKVKQSETKKEQKKTQHKKKNDAIDPSLPNVVVPCLDKSISEFAFELAEYLKDKKAIFFRTDSKELVEIREIDGKVGFVYIKPNRLITLVENYLNIGINKYNKDIEEYEFHIKSMAGDVAKTVLDSFEFQSQFPQIKRIFPVQMPIVYNGKLTMPERGYDERFKSWLQPDAPEIKLDMSLEDAKKLIEETFEEFCFTKPQDKTNAIAALFTPFLHGLMPKFNTRMPVFFYLANRERAGKDYCAGVTSILLENRVVEETPISYSDNDKNNVDELRKKLLSAYMYGKKRMHFSNNRGYINNAVFESTITNETYGDRVLGRSENIEFDNEIDFSLSGNIGVSFTPDLANRSRFIHLFLEIEDANQRDFKRKELHEWVTEHRTEVLSAIFSIINHWYEAGAIRGKTPFASYPHWAAICGGIMQFAEFGDPCVPDKENSSVGGDTETSEMKALYEICALNPVFLKEFVTKQDIIDHMRSIDNELFGYLDFTKTSDKTKFGMKLHKMIGRCFSGIKMVVENPQARTVRQKFKFVRIEQQETVYLPCSFEDFPGHRCNRIENCVFDAHGEPRCPRHLYEEERV